MEVMTPVLPLERGPILLLYQLGLLLVQESWGRGAWFKCSKTL